MSRSFTRKGGWVDGLEVRLPRSRSDADQQSDEGPRPAIAVASSATQVTGASVSGAIVTCAG